MSDTEYSKPNITDCLEKAKSYIPYVELAMERLSAARCEVEAEDAINSIKFFRHKMKHALKGK